MFSPLEQFEIVSYLSLRIPYNGFDYLVLAFTNQTITLFFIASFLFFFLYTLALDPYYFNFEYFILIDRVYTFVKTLILENLSGFWYIRYFVFIFFLFLFILFSNLTGMVPYSFTPTSHLIVTFTFSFLTFITGTLVGIYRNGIAFLSLFLPAGAPYVIAPFIISIEIISYLARLFSLSIRLFANIMAGHTLLKILTSFCWIMINMGIFMFFVQLLPLTIIFAITGLEIIIGVLQAYVFTILSIIYFNDAFNLH